MKQNNPTFTRPLRLTAQTHLFFLKPFFPFSISSLFQCSTQTKNKPKKTSPNLLPNSPQNPPREENALKNFPKPKKRTSAEKIIPLFRTAAGHLQPPFSAPLIFIKRPRFLLPRTAHPSSRICYGFTKPIFFVFLQMCCDEDAKREQCQRQSRNGKGRTQGAYPQLDLQVTVMTQLTFKGSTRGFSSAEGCAVFSLGG